jgi:putative membrane protein
MSDLNDPRVLFAAERTLLAWSRTSLTLMAFGFVIERFGLFIRLLLPRPSEGLEKGVSFWVGIAFVLLGASASVFANIQFRKVLKTLRPVEIPDRYNVNGGVVTNYIVAALGVALTVYLFSQGDVR